MRPRKSRTCTGKRSGRPLTEYASRSEAENAAYGARMTFGCRMTPYLCVRCVRWHLTRADRYAPSIESDRCTDRRGRPKQTYTRHEHAVRRAKLVKADGGRSLRVYACARCCGWHLTSG